MGIERFYTQFTHTSRFIHNIDNINSHISRSLFTDYGRAYYVYFFLYRKVQVFSPFGLYDKRNDKKKEIFFLAYA